MLKYFLEFEPIHQLSRTAQLRGWVVISDKGPKITLGLNFRERDELLQFGSRKLNLGIYHRKHIAALLEAAQFCRGKRS